jgi:hypothetical protein
LPATASQKAYLEAADKLRAMAAAPSKSNEAREQLVRFAALYEKPAEHSARRTDSASLPKMIPDQ